MTDQAAIEPIGQQDIAQRRAELQRMRVYAVCLLVLMLIVFIAASTLQARCPWLSYLRAFAEAAMVGACADWFAVVSLFRHPFGIPIPHTAIVPRHKKRIGENLGLFITNNFLAPTEVAHRLKSVDAAGWAVRWVREPSNAKLLASRLQVLFPSLLELLGEQQVRGFSRSVMRKGIDSIAAAPLAGRLLSVLVAHGLHDRAFDLAIEQAQMFLEQHKAGIRQRVAKNSVRWLPEWVDGKLTDAFLAELQHTLLASQAADHPWRIEFHSRIDGLIAQLADDDALLQRCEQIKGEVLDHSVVDGYLDWLSHEIEAKVQTELAAADGILSSGLEQALLAFGNWLDNDTTIRAMINRWAQQLVLNSVVPNRAEIGAFVAEVVAKWDASTLVDKLELQVGKDLQYIRINGTLVGGLVGLIIFTVSRMFG